MSVNETCKPVNGFNGLSNEAAGLSALLSPSDSLESQAFPTASEEPNTVTDTLAGVEKLPQADDLAGASGLSGLESSTSAVVEDRTSRTSTYRRHYHPTNPDAPPRVRSAFGASDAEIVAARASRKAALRSEVFFDTLGVPVARAVLRVLRASDPDYTTILGGTSGGNCTGVDLDEMFTVGASQSRARDRVCVGCALRATCLGYALAKDVQFGLWGATERERRAILREYPDIEGWARDKLADDPSSMADTRQRQLDDIATVSEQRQYRSGFRA